MLTYTVSRPFGDALAPSALVTLVKGTDFVCSASICYSKSYKQNDAIHAMFKELQHQINQYAAAVYSRTPFTGYAPLKLDGFIGAGTVALLTKAMASSPPYALKWSDASPPTKDQIAAAAPGLIEGLKNSVIQMTTPNAPPTANPPQVVMTSPPAPVAPDAAALLAQRQAATDAAIAAAQAGQSALQQQQAAAAAATAVAQQQQAAAGQAPLDPEEVYGALLKSGTLTIAQLKGRCAKYPKVGDLVRANDPSWDDQCMAYEQAHNLGPYAGGQSAPQSNTLWWALGGGAILVLVVGAFFAAKATRRPDPAPSIGDWRPRPAPQHACPDGEFWTRGRCKRILWR